MAEPEIILQFLEDFFQKKKGYSELTGYRVLITAGPTYEALDPVRFIGNRSTGKMGLALANECLSRGAQVSLIIGPVSVSTPEGIETVRVESADEMAQAVFEREDQADIIILAAAVADYKASRVSAEKIKKQEGKLHLELERTTDIAATLGLRKKSGKLLIGFALETQNAVENALAKLKKKNFDLIVLNSLQDEGAGFGHDTNKVSIIGKDNKITHFELKSKAGVASDIVDQISRLIRRT